MSGGKDETWVDNCWIWIIDPLLFISVFAFLYVFSIIKCLQITKWQLMFITISIFVKTKKIKFS